MLLRRMWKTGKWMDRIQGRIQDYVPGRTLKAFWQGSRARLRAVEALGLF